MGDLNGRVGNDYATGQGALGRYGGEAMRNGNGQRIVNFYVENRLVITFVGDGRFVQSVIDYIIFTQSMRRIFRDIKVIRGAEITSHHHLLIADSFFEIEKERTEGEKI
jgi:hypothetical protein